MIRKLFGLKSLIVFVALSVLSLGPVPAEQPSGATQTPGKIAKFADDLSLVDSVVTEDDNGNIGFGTPSPRAKLHVTDKDRMAIILGGPSTSDGAVGSVAWEASDGAPVGGVTRWVVSYRTDTWGVNAPGSLVFYTDVPSTLRMGFKPNGDVVIPGNVGIGTVTPTAKLHVIGDFIATGSKSALVETASYGKRQLYAVESPENWFEDFGKAKLINGQAVVKLDPVFSETVNTENDYHVFLTPKGDCKGLYVANQTAHSFAVKELRKGKSTIAFDYRIVAKRKGYEQARLAEVKDAKESKTAEVKLADARK